MPRARSLWRSGRVYFLALSAPLFGDWVDFAVDDRDFFSFWRDGWEGARGVIA